MILKKRGRMNNAPYRKILILNAGLLIKYALYSIWTILSKVGK